MKNKFKFSLTIGYLYGQALNTYADYGNIIALTKRAEWRHIQIKIKPLGFGARFKPQGMDMFFIGGGQDKAQSLVADDLQSRHKGLELKRAIEDEIPLLAICAGYQLLGEYYQPAEGKVLLGTNIFSCYTVAGKQRMIGNIISNGFCGPLLGFENHSGQTFLHDETQALGQVVVGYGNNLRAQSEGCRHKNALGTYLHGPLLPKNPRLTDWLLGKALGRKYQQDIQLEPLADEWEISAQQTMFDRLLVENRFNLKG